LPRFEIILDIAARNFLDVFSPTPEPDAAVVERAAAIARLGACRRLGQAIDRYSIGVVHGRVERCDGATVDTGAAAAALRRLSDESVARWRW
jgi:hypothetical protein